MPGSGGAEIHMLATGEEEILRLVGLAVMLTGVMACGTGVPDIPETGPISYADHLEPLIVKRCLACHETEDPKAELVLEVGSGYAQMVGRTSTQVPKLQIVHAGSSELSYLWVKLEHEQNVGKGMPRTLFGEKRLPERELELIRRWIEGGAKP